jgi:hypothetical protein
LLSSDGQSDGKQRHSGGEQQPLHDSLLWPMSALGKTDWAREASWSSSYEGTATGQPTKAPGTIPGLLDPDVSRQSLLPI